MHDKPTPKSVLEAVALIRETPPEWSSEILRATWETLGPERMLIETNRLRAARKESQNPFLLCRRASDPAVHTAPPMLWLGIYKGGLTTVAGQTGAGKSSWAYNVAISAAKGEPLWNIPFPGPQNVLYIDPENAGWISENKVRRLAGESCDNLYFHDGHGVDLSNPQWIHWLIEAIQELEIDLVVADPRANLFSTVNENDNAAAAAEFKRLLEVIHVTRCAMVLLDHTGKSSENWQGRGASSRAGMAHVVASFTVKTESEEVNDDYQADNPRSRTDICRFKIFKDRFLGLDCSTYLQMCGNDRFLRVPFESWLGDVSDGGRQTACLRAKEAVLQFASDAAIGGNADPIRQRDVATALDLAGHKRNTIYQAMSELEAEGRIVSLALDGRSKGILLKGQAEALGLVQNEGD